MDIYKLTVHQCGCGYRTGDYGNANRHKKGACGHEMVKKEMRFVSEEDHLAALGNTSPNVGNVSTYIANNTDNSTNTNNTHIGDVNNNITNNITLMLPERTTKEDFIEYLETLGRLGFRTPEQIATMPGKMLMFTRDAKKLPGALVERDKKIIEKLPDGTERVMGKKKAIQTYTHEAVDALCLRPPADGIIDFFETERGFKRTKISLQDAAKLRVTNPRGYHQGVPDDVKFRHQKIESHTEKYLDKITSENKTNGFL
jgi:hypothetical protein